MFRGASVHEIPEKVNVVYMHAPPSQNKRENTNKGIKVKEFALLETTNFKNDVTHPIKIEDKIWPMSPLVFDGGEITENFDQSITVAEYEVISAHQCPTCDKSYASKGDLKQHMKLHSGNDFACTFCEKRFRSNYRLKLHLNVHANSNEYKCNICGRKYFYHQGLKRHMRDHDPNVVFQCKGCPLVFSRRCELEKHSKYHTAGIHQCDICFKVYSGRNCLARHKKIHSGENIHICTVCGKRYSDRGCLIRHVKVHTGHYYHCNDCERKYTEKTALKEHIFTVHLPSEGYTCQFCGKVLARKYNWEIHTKRHLGLNDFTCHCGKSFNGSYELKRHYRTHLEVGVYECHCGRTFGGSSQLTMHARSHGRQEEKLKLAQEKAAKAVQVKTKTKSKAKVTKKRGESKKIPKGVAEKKKLGKINARERSIESTSKPKSVKRSPSKGKVKTQSKSVKRSPSKGKANTKKAAKSKASKNNTIDASLTLDKPGGKCLPVSYDKAKKDDVKMTKSKSKVCKSVLRTALENEANKVAKIDQVTSAMPSVKSKANSRKRKSADTLVSKSKFQKSILNNGGSSKAVTKKAIGNRRKKRIDVAKHLEIGLVEGENELNFASEADCKIMVGEKEELEIKLFIM